MSTKIKLTKSISLERENLPNESWEVLLNTMTIELKHAANRQGQSAHEWTIHRKRRSPLYNGLVDTVKRTAIGTLTINQNLFAQIEGRNSELIDVKIKDIDIIDYDWKDIASFMLFFESEEYFLCDRFGTSLVLSSTKDGANTIMVDMKDDTISISQMIEES